jgi:hypothetical protein
MKIQTLLLLGELGTLALSGCSENGVNCNDQSQTVQWQLDTIAVAQRVAVNGIWGVNQSDVYAVGMVDSGQGPVGTVWHYDGTDWSVVHTRANAELQDVHIVSANSVWIAGIGNPDSYPGEALVLHWNGSNWEESFSNPGLPGLLAVWAGADDEVYAVGRDETILRFDGATWIQEDIEVPGLENPEFGDMRDVWGVGHNESSKVYVGGGDGRGVVLARVRTSPCQLEFVTPYGGWPGYCVGVWARDTNDVYALEWTGKGVASVGNIYHMQDTTWNKLLGPGFGTPQCIRGDPAGDVYALGAYVDRYTDDDILELYPDFPGRGTFALNDIWPDGTIILIAGSSTGHGVILKRVGRSCGS